MSRFVHRLSSLARTCEFGTFLVRGLRDQIVKGCYSEELRRVLLNEYDVSLERALKIAGSVKTNVQVTTKYIN